MLILTEAQAAHPYATLSEMARTRFCDQMRSETSLDKDEPISPEAMSTVITRFNDSLREGLVEAGMNVPKNFVRGRLNRLLKMCESMAVAGQRNALSSGRRPSRRPVAPTVTIPPDYRESDDRFTIQTMKRFNDGPVWGALTLYLYGHHTLSREKPMTPNLSSWLAMKISRFVIDTGTRTATVAAVSLCQGVQLFDEYSVSDFGFDGYVDNAFQRSHFKFSSSEGKKNQGDGFNPSDIIVTSYQNSGPFPPHNTHGTWENPTTPGDVSALFSAAIEGVVPYFRQQAGRPFRQ